MVEKSSKTALLLTLVGVMISLLTLWLGGSWAMPSQKPASQTVPTPPSPPKREPPPAPPPPSPTLSPTLRPAIATFTPTPLPAYTATPALTPATLPAARPSPTPGFILPGPTPAASPPKGGCLPLEKELSPSHLTRFDLLEPCRILIEVPAGAVSEAFPARLSPRRPIEAPVSQPSLEMRSLAFKFEVFLQGALPLLDFIFARPYTVTVRYVASDLEVTGGDPERLVIAYFDEAAGRWEALESRADVERRLVSARWNRPGWLALMAQIFPLSPTPQPVETVALAFSPEKSPAPTRQGEGPIPSFPSPGLLVVIFALAFLAFLTVLKLHRAQRKK